MVQKPYRSLLGALLYLSTRTGSYLAVAVSLLGKYQSDPGMHSWNTLENVIRYLSGTPYYGILLPVRSAAISLEAWSDADWAREKDRRKSRSGYVLTINGGFTVWSSRLHTATAQSTAEAEFAALAFGV